MDSVVVGWAGAAGCSGVLHATTRHCMQQHHIACNEVLLQCTPILAQKCGLKASFLHVATTKNATTRNCKTTGTRCIWIGISSRLQFVVCVDSPPRHLQPLPPPTAATLSTHKTYHSTHRALSNECNNQLSRDFLGQEEDEEVRRRGRREKETR